MSKVFIEESSLTAIGDAIRAKSGDTALMSPAAMVTAIENISTGGGGGEVVATTKLGYFNYGGRYSDESLANIKTENITNGDLESAFVDARTNVDMSGFVINMNTSENLQALQLFNGCNNLEKLPVFQGTAGVFYRGRYMFQDCYRLREIPNDFFTKWDPGTVTTWYGQSLFQNCYSLRELPDLSCYNGWDMSSSTWRFYAYLCFYCVSLNKIENLPVFNNYTTVSSDMFTNAFSGCARLNKFTFATDNGTPYHAAWKNQTIDLSDAGFAGSTNTRNQILNYNSGITTDSEVTSKTAYNNLKDTEDWFAYGSGSAAYFYSRYNRASAVETIHSLPDTSTGTTGANNIIKFRGPAGSMTDGGSISNLTEAEIAVATVKGWTVTFVY